MLLETDASKYVNEYEHTIECFEAVKEDSNGVVDEDDHLEENRRRKKRVRKVVQLDAFFDPRSSESDEKLQSVSRVLLVGDPGVGKTSISRKYAFLWGQGELGNDFLAVYVLPFNKLSRKEFDNSGRTKKSLSTAIANFCFPFEEKDVRYENRRQKISDDLTEETTLLILDGFDESDEVGREMFDQVFDLGCKLLLATRPYNLSDVRKQVRGTRKLRF